MDGGEPDIPIYKVIECTGPTNTRVYKVAVYFRGKRLASSTGHSIQQAEMEAAKKALENSSELFPQLDYQKRVMAHSMKHQKGKNYDGDRKRNRLSDHRSSRKQRDDDSNLPKQYRVQEDSKASFSDSNSASNSNSDSESESDSNSSDVSHSSHSITQIKKLKHTKPHKHHGDHKCSHSTSVEDGRRNVDDNSSKVQTISNNDNENSIANEDNDSDTDISLESGEIP